MPFIEQGAHFPTRSLYKNPGQEPVRSFNRVRPKNSLRGDHLPVIARRVSKELPETLMLLAMVDDKSGRR
jgi:hypothetical protein